MRLALIASIAPLALAACAQASSLPDNGEGAQALPGNDAGFAANDFPGAVPLLLPLDRADFERTNMLGAGCLWRAAAAAPAVLVITDKGGAVKIDGNDVALAPDPASATLPEGGYDLKTTHKGGGIALEIRRAAGAWKATGPETREAPADLTITTANGRGELKGGVLACGA